MQEPNWRVRPFGEDNRAELLDEYFGTSVEVTAENAWAHVYRLLLWIDPTTGLVHCYESDKSQPGRPWYARMLSVHTWIANRLEVDPLGLDDQLDWMFKRVVAQLVDTVEQDRRERQARYEEQRRPYEGIPLPLPGEDPELERLILDAVDPYLEGGIPATVLAELTTRIRVHLNQENKRKNLLGEGFEDTIAAICRRVLPAALEVATRRPLHELPGFYPPRGNDRPAVVDLSVGDRAGHGSPRRVLVTCKWSFRADRERQFTDDFNEYARLEAMGESFDYVLLTNEFDPARLLAACERRRENDALFTYVVHMQPGAVAATYADGPSKSARRVLEYIRDGRLIGLSDWLLGLGAVSPADGM